MDVAAAVPGVLLAASDATVRWCRGLLFHHSMRVFLFGALTGEWRQLAYGAELL